MLDVRPGVAGDARGPHGFWRVAPTCSRRCCVPGAAGRVPGRPRRAAGDALCAEGYAGAMCDACDDGFAPRSDGTCAECDADYRTKVLQAAGVAAGVRSSRRCCGTGAARTSCCGSTSSGTARRSSSGSATGSRFCGARAGRFRAGARARAPSRVGARARARARRARDARARGSLALAALTRSLRARARRQPPSLSRRCSRSTGAVPDVVARLPCFRRLSWFLQLFNFDVAASSPRAAARPQATTASCSRVAGRSRSSSRARTARRARAARARARAARGRGVAAALPDRAALRDRVRARHRGETNLLGDGDRRQSRPERRLRRPLVPRGEERSAQAAALARRFSERRARASSFFARSGVAALRVRRRGAVGRGRAAALLRRAAAPRDYVNPPLDASTRGGCRAGVDRVLLGVRPGERAREERDTRVVSVPSLHTRFPLGTSRI